MKKIGSKKFDLSSFDEKVQLMLKELKEDSKTYQRLLEGLQVLGNFKEHEYLAEIYDVKVVDKNNKVRLCFTDEIGNIFIIYGKSNDKKDSLIINKSSNEKDCMYDISLAKKAEINQDNIEVTRTDKTYGLKFGRLITDDKNFYSLLLGNEIVYQIEGDFDKGMKDILISKLNKVESNPQLVDFIKIVETITQENNISFNEATIRTFKSFYKIGEFKIGSKNVEEIKLK
jgi:hypothetical protein